MANAKNVKNVEMVKIGDVECVLNLFNGICGDSTEEISVKIPNKFIFEGSVEDSFFIEEFDFKVKSSKECGSEFEQVMKFYIPEVKEITKIYKGELTDKFEFVGLMADRIVDDKKVGYTCVSYSILDKKGNYLFTNLQPATAIAIIARFKNITYSKADKWYQMSIGRTKKSGATGISTKRKNGTGNTFSYN